MQRTSIGISLDRNTIAKIDASRGDVSRSRYLERIVLKHLGEQEHE